MTIDATSKDALESGARYAEVRIILTVPADRITKANEFANNPRALRFVTPGKQNIKFYNPTLAPPVQNGNLLMNSITINELMFDGLVRFSLLGNVREIVDFISCELLFGKCYCFDSELTKGGWGLSWIISGQVKQNSGSIIRNEKDLSIKDRRLLSQCVGMDVFDYNIFGKKTIKKQIENLMGHKLSVLK